MQVLFDDSPGDGIGRRIDGLAHPVEECVVQLHLASKNVSHGSCHYPFLEARSRRPGRCLRTPVFFGLSFFAGA